MQQLEAGNMSIQKNRFVTTLTIAFWVVLFLDFILGYTGWLSLCGTRCCCPCSDTTLSGGIQYAHEHLLGNARQKMYAYGGLWALFIMEATGLLHPFAPVFSRPLPSCCPFGSYYLSFPVSFFFFFFTQISNKLTSLSPNETFLCLHFLFAIYPPLWIQAHIWLSNILLDLFNVIPCQNLTLSTLTITCHGIVPRLSALSCPPYSAWVCLLTIRFLPGGSGAGSLGTASSQTPALRFVSFQVLLTRCMHNIFKVEKKHKFFLLCQLWWRLYELQQCQVLPIWLEYEVPACHQSWG